ncbi:hypothetical protein PR048_013072, partial [Dryococelus australis]
MSRLYLRILSNLSLVDASRAVAEVLNVLENVKTFNLPQQLRFFIYYKVNKIHLWQKILNCNLCALQDGLLKTEASVANGLSAFFEKTSSLFNFEVSVIIFGITEELARNLQTSDISITSFLRQTEIDIGHLTGLMTQE